MNTRIICHKAVSLTREANKIATVWRSLGHNVVVEDYLTASTNKSYDFELFIGTCERYALKRFDVLPNIVFYLTIEGKHNYNDYKPKHPIIAVSKFARDMLIDSGYKVEDVVYHGFDLNWFNLSPPNRPRLFGAKRMWLLHKIWTPRQRIDLIVESLKILKQKYNPSISLLDLGKPPLSFYLKGVYPSSTYFLIPYLPDEFIVGSYKASDLYIHLSTSEGFGLTLLEALGCGIPSIYVDAPPMNEILPKSYGYKVPYVYEDWLNIHPYEEFDFKEYIFNPEDAVEVLYSAYEGKNQYVDKSYINNFDMFKLYPKLLEWCKQYVRA